MSTALLSGALIALIYALAGWAVVSANRAPPPARLAAGAYAGVDMDTFVSAWTRKFWRRGRSDRNAASAEKPA